MDKNTQPNATLAFDLEHFNALIADALVHELPLDTLGAEVSEATDTPQVADSGEAAATTAALLSTDTEHEKLPEISQEPAERPAQQLQKTGAAVVSATAPAKPRRQRRAERYPFEFYKEGRATRAELERFQEYLYSVGAAARQKRNVERIYDPNSDPRR